MSAIAERIKGFLQATETIGLDQMEHVSQQNRIDKKYLIHQDQLFRVLEKILDEYYLLEINGCRVFTYQTVYYDTPDYRFYKDHHNGLGNRIKVRCRRYVETDTTFFEIKRKYQGTRTDKFRKLVPAFLTIPGAEEYEEIKARYTKYAVADLAITLTNSFRRATLVSRKMNERVTIDFDISFHNQTRDALLSNVAIIEVKQGKYDDRSPMVQVLKKERIYSGSISKYSYGMLLLDEYIKYNAFKPIMNRIAKIQRNGIDRSVA